MAKNISNISSNIRLVKKQLANALDIPQDLLGASILTVTGTAEALLENYKGILSYSDTEIICQARNCKIILEGKRLNIDYYTNEDCKITGVITSVSYVP